MSQSQDPRERWEWGVQQREEAKERPQLSYYEDPDGYITVQEAAKVVKRANTTVQQWCLKGFFYATQIPPVGGRWLIHKGKFFQWLNSWDNQQSLPDE